eukprot:1300121-Prorocentrum_lima.AAC.1
MGSAAPAASSSLSLLATGGAQMGFRHLGTSTSSGVTLAPTVLSIPPELLADARPDMEDQVAGIPPSSDLLALSE